MDATGQTPLRRSPVRAAPPPSSIHVYGDPRLDLTFDDCLADGPTAASEAARLRARQLGKRRADSHSCALGRVLGRSRECPRGSLAGVCEARYAATGESARRRSTIRAGGARPAAREERGRRGGMEFCKRARRRRISVARARTDWVVREPRRARAIGAPARGASFSSGDPGPPATSQARCGRPRVPAVEPVRLDRKPVGRRPGDSSARERAQPPAKELRGRQARSESSERDRSDTTSGFRRFPCSSAANERARR
jgi:hypothetical protein